MLVEPGPVHQGPRLGVLGLAATVALVFGLAVVGRVTTPAAGPPASSAARLALSPPGPSAAVATIPVPPLPDLQVTLTEPRPGVPIVDAGAVRVAGRSSAGPGRLEAWLLAADGTGSQVLMGSTFVDVAADGRFQGLVFTGPLDRGVAATMAIVDWQRLPGQAAAVDFPLLAGPLAITTPRPASSFSGRLLVVAGSTDPAIRRVSIRLLGPKGDVLAATGTETIPSGAPPGSGQSPRSLFVADLELSGLGAGDVVLELRAGPVDGSGPSSAVRFPLRLAPATLPASG